jgi:flavin reductase (DIM6/NTAB) family NADH-FMN oxidoreductase RutF
VEGGTAEQARRSQEFSAADFRGALGAFATGVTVITTHGEAEAYGMTANAFSSVSLDPPLVLVCVINGTTGAETIEQNRVFAVNVLGAHQEAISRYFASRDRPKGRSAFSTVPHFTAVTGSPILERVAAYLDCRLDAAHESGDHVIYIGEVLALGVDKEIPPLVFHHGGYSVLGDR